MKAENSTAHHPYLLEKKGFHLYVEGTTNDVLDNSTV